MRSPFASILVLLGCLALAPASASADVAGPAQTPSAADVGQARTLYQQGNAAADAGRFDDALSLFTRAYGLSGNPAALYNVARTLRSLGRHVDARRAFDQLLTAADLSDATRTEATQLRDEEAARVAELSLEDLPDASPDLQLRVDGVFHPDGGTRPLRLELDAGEHGLVVSLAGFTSFTWQDTLVGGAHEQVSVQLTAAPHGGSIVQEPLFWVILGAVVIAGAVVGGYFAWDAQQLRPEGPTVIRL